MAQTMVANCLSNKKILDGYDNRFNVFSDLCFTNFNIHIEANRFFRVMDRDYPGSYFIYNTRDTERWIQSRLNHSYNDVTLKSRFFSIFNTTDIEVLKKIWRNEKSQFEFELREYFKNSSKFVTIDIESDNVSEAMSSFLGLKFNEEHWRKLNVTVDC